MKMSNIRISMRARRRWRSGIHNGRSWRCTISWGVKGLRSITLLLRCIPGLGLRNLVVGRLGWEAGVSMRLMVHERTMLVCARYVNSMRSLVVNLLMSVASMDGWQGWSGRRHRGRPSGLILPSSIAQEMMRVRLWGFIEVARRWRVCPAGTLRVIVTRRVIRRFGRYTMR